MKIVQFADGKYGIRSTFHWLTGEYISLHNYNFKYKASDHQFGLRCKLEDLDKVKAIYADLTGKHKVIPFD